MARQMNTGRLSNFFEKTGTYVNMTEKEQQIVDTRNKKSRSNKGS